jgi:hypothetical protein
MPLNNDPFALSNDGYLIIQTSPVDDGQQIQQLDGPQPYVDALFKLNDHFIDLIEADNGYAFDAELHEPSWSSSRTAKTSRRALAIVATF